MARVAQILYRLQLVDTQLSEQLSKLGKPRACRVRHQSCWRHARRMGRLPPKLRFARKVCVNWSWTCRLSMSGSQPRRNGCMEAR